VEGETTVHLFATDGDTLKSSFSAQKGLQPFPLQMLGDYSILTRRTDRQKVASWRASVDRREPGLRHDPRPFIKYEVADLSTQEAQDITPANLDGTLEWPCNAGPPFIWSEERGFTFFIPDLESREVQVWQGNSVLADVQHTPPVLALGQGFVDGQLTCAVVSDDGGMMVYDHETGLMEHSERHAALGNQIANVVRAPEERPVRFVFAEGVAVVKPDSDKAREGQELVTVTADGVIRTFKEVDPFSTKADGTQREPDEAHRLVIDASPIRLEGKQQPPDVTTGICSLLPLDDMHVGVFDMLYQRLTVVGPQE